MKIRNIALHALGIGVLLLGCQPTESVQKDQQLNNERAPDDEFDDREPFVVPVCRAGMFGVEREATIYVGPDNRIVGGPLDGRLYTGTLQGSRNGDVIVGTDGDDIIEGAYGDDFICAGLGDDTVSGGRGNDGIQAKGGHNYVQGGDGDDFITTGIGNDDLDGGDGADHLWTDGGHNVIRGGQGGDDISCFEGIHGASLDGSVSAAAARGSFGNNLVLGDLISKDKIDSAGSGHGDTVSSAGEGQDWIDCGPGDDEIYGHGNRDVITDLGGDNYIDGGAGDDEIEVAVASDLIDVPGEQVAGRLHWARGFSHIVGGDGADVLSTDQMNGSVMGGRGNDVLDAYACTVFVEVLHSGNERVFSTCPANAVVLDGGLGTDSCGTSGAQKNCEE